jgi:hypothetical protein
MDWLLEFLARLRAEDRFAFEDKAIVCRMGKNTFDII